jgi:predicted Fe-S protein YdhL (DUF1289 family)
VDDTTDPTGEVPSPCVKKCGLDGQNICRSCLRTIQEIIVWQSADSSTRRNILREVEERRKRLKVGY